MRTAYLNVLVAITAGTPVVVMAQSAPGEVVAPTPVTSAPVKSTLFKVGTGLTRGFALGGSSGLSMPVVLGVEHHLTPAVSIYGDLYAGIQLVDSRVHNRPFLSRTGTDAGVRYYYNQDSRKQKGRKSGPFVGNYLALHSTTKLYSYRLQNDYSTRFHLSYAYSNLSALWGMQRRVGGHGLFDAYAGVGVANPYRFYIQDGQREYKRRPTFDIEFGVKLSLVP